MEQEIYKVMTKKEWQDAKQNGVFKGSEVDVSDGFIHFSTAAQVQETVGKHFAGQQDLLLIRFGAEQFGDVLKWEISRGGDMFPHLYGDLPVEAANSVWQLPLKSDGQHQFPSQY